ncbi:MAG: hypothetical protein NZ534_12675, partial [Bacteroidia bacterium]|nr:hypothetical protein [Bacteroidia bacterium]
EFVRQEVCLESLSGFPHCPYCGNRYGFSICACARLFCSSGGKDERCPWCGAVVALAPKTGGIEVIRLRG